MARSKRVIKVDITSMQHDLTCGWLYGSCRLCDLLAHVTTWENMSA